MSSTPASLWLRLAAAIYDLFPLIALWMLTAGLALLLVHGRVDLAHPTIAWRIGLRVALLAITAAYFVISWTRGGQTIGMRAWRLRIVRTDGAPLDTRQAIVRFIVSVVSLVAAGLGFWWALFDAQNRTWHDLAAGTLMVRIEKKGPGTRG